jgi:hypothetical protein
MENQPRKTNANMDKLYLTVWHQNLGGAKVWHHLRFFWYCKNPKNLKIFIRAINTNNICKITGG